MNTVESSSQKSCLRFLNSAAIGFSVGLLVAPCLGAPTNPITKPAEVIEMSPFEVTSTVDSGYVGQETLAGSRVRTRLFDLAAAISPLTEEFLRDIAVTDVGQAVEYSLSTRLNTEDGSAAAVAGSYMDVGGSARGIRIRGLPGGSRTLNYFSTTGEIDTYMTGGIEVARGPNSILYGFGSPSGLVNVSTKPALLNKNAYSLSNRIDSWGGERWIADVNFAAIKNKLGVRVIALRGREDSWRSFGHNDQDRVFLTAKWRIDQKTTLKVDFEHAKSDDYTPRPYFGLDLTSLWEANGRPVFNNFSPTYVPGTAGTSAGTPGTPIRDTGAGNIVGVIEIGAIHIVASDRFAYLQNYRQFTRADFPVTPNVPTPDFEMGRRNPKAVLEANWISGAREQNLVTATLQRELFPDLHMELAVNRLKYQSLVNNIQWNWNGISADTNKYLPDGTLKPADMVYYYENSTNKGDNSEQITQLRLALSYERKLGRLGKLELGRLRLGALGETSAYEKRFTLRNQYWLKGPEITSGGFFNPTPENATNRVVYRNYIPDINAIYDPNFTVPGPSALPNPMKYKDPGTGVISNVYLHEFNANAVNPNYSDRRVDSYMGVAQLYTFGDRLVGTFGARQDRLKSQIGVPIRDPAAEAIQANTGVFIPVDPGKTKAERFSGGTYTAGAVFHFTRWLAGFYNQSRNRNIPSAFFVTPRDPTESTRPDLPPTPEGTTDDYGIKLSLFKNRVFVTATKYHTISKGEITGNQARGATAGIWTALANSTLLSAADATAALGRAEVIQQASQLVRDSESKGTELEIVGQPLKGWSVSLNYANAKSAQSNIGRDFRAYLDHWKPYWFQYRNLALNQNANLPGPEYAAGSDNWTTEGVLRTTNVLSTSIDSINESVANIESIFFQSAPIFEGRPFIGEPRHSFNFRTRYDFQTGILKGLSVGGGVRMRKGRAAGAMAVWTLAPGTNYADAYNGRVVERTETVTAADQNVYDLQIGYGRPILKDKRVMWRVQLNVNNVINQRELIVNNTDPATLQPRQYRYQDPRQYMLTNTFSF